MADGSSSTQAVGSTPPRKRTRIEHIEQLADIEELSVLQLKEVLATSYVDYRGCVEKWELQERVSRLWQDTAENKRRGQYL